MINLNQSVLSGLKLQYPPIRDQRGLATAVSDMDALLAKLNQLIAKKRDLKPAAVQQRINGEISLHVSIVSSRMARRWRMSCGGDVAGRGVGVLSIGSERRCHAQYELMSSDGLAVTCF